MHRSIVTGKKGVAVGQNMSIFFPASRVAESLTSLVVHCPTSTPQLWLKDQVGLGGIWLDISRWVGGLLLTIVSN